jgi:tRNA(Arg) A34 adenosine deaminase TadA
MMCKKIQDVTIRTARKSIFPRFKHGSVIAQGGRVIAKGVNTPKPRTPDNSFSTHAEIVTLKRLITHLVRQNKNAKFEIYVARVTPTNSVGSSKPCPKCMEALKKSGIIYLIHYTNNDGKWESMNI